ncbi:MAG: ATP-binding protein [Dehalococcoidia bacterium]
MPRLPAAPPTSRRSRRSTRLPRPSPRTARLARGRLAARLGAIGYTPEELIDKTLTWVVHPDDREMAMHFLRQTRSTRAAAPVRIRFQHSDGQIVWLEARARRMESGSQERPGSIVTVAREATAQVQMEADLHQAKDEAERASRAKSEFLSRVSHELRTPMNAILGFGQLLEMEPLEPEERDEVGQILAAARHLLNLMNDVIEIARVESGRLALSLEAVPPATIAEECLPLVSSLAAERGVLFSVDKASLGTLHVRADNQRLKQVLINLLSNAVKYNREGGTVTLSCRRLPKEQLRIEVRDSGIGIAEDKLPRLFTPFDRLGAEQTTVEGSGLGLALCKSLVEAMGGSLGLSSVVDEGSNVWVELPLVQSPIHAVEPATADAQAHVAARAILYIEDNLSNLQVVERVLSRRPGVKLLTAMQGGLGFELARQHQPDLILLDLHLPDTTGDLVLHRLQADPRTRDLPVVMVSADATTGQIERLLAGGAREYLTKPLDLKRFAEVVDGILAEQ